MSIESNRPINSSIDRSNYFIYIHVPIVGSRFSHSKNLIPVDRYSESESQIGNSGSEDNCSLVNSHGTTANSGSSNGNKESTGKNHSVIGQYSQNGSIVSSSEIAGQFANGHASNGSLEHVSLKENTGKDSSKNKSGNSAKKNSNKRSRNR